MLDGETLVVSHGGGSNSTAGLIGMHERGIRPELIMFADTGSEKPITYDFLKVMNLWLEGVGFPQITIVKNDLPKGVSDGTLYNECLRLGTLPSKTFGRSNCSQKWKIKPQEKFLKAWMKERGITHVQHFVGYDAGEVKRSQKPIPPRDYETNRYLLIEWGWGRDECVAAITRAGLPQPGKSACFMCPSSKKPEVRELRRDYAHLFEMACVLEHRALAGEGQAPAARVAGLGRHWNWEKLDFVKDEDLPNYSEGIKLDAVSDCRCTDGDVDPTLEFEN